jgi:hypothetical protein
MRTKEILTFLPGSVVKKTGSFRDNLVTTQSFQKITGKNSF